MTTEGFKKQEEISKSWIYINKLLSTIQKLDAEFTHTFAHFELNIFENNHKRKYILTNKKNKKSTIFENPKVLAIYLGERTYHIYNK